MSRSCVARSMATPASWMRSGHRADARGVRAEDAADAPVGDQLLELADRRVEALDVADHQLDAGRASGGGHAQAVLQRGGDRLLDEHVLARGDRVERDLGVLRGGRRDADRVDVAARDQVAVGLEVRDRPAADALVSAGWRRARRRRRRARPRRAPTSRGGRSPIRPRPTMPIARSLMLLPPVHCSASATTSSAIRCAARPSPKIGGRSAGRGRKQPGGERLGVDADEHVPARGDGVDPLGLLAQRQARDAPEVGLALHAAGVGGDRLRAALELEHARVGDRVDEIDVARHRQLPRRQRGAGARVHGEDHAPGRARRGSPARAAGGRGRRCCSCGAPWRAGTRPRPARSRRASARACRTAGRR